MEEGERIVGETRVAVRVPQSFRDMPRWWRGGTGWLDRLPVLVAEWCTRWRLTVTGEPVHGSDALVVPVSRGGDLFALRLAPPGSEVAGHVAALRFWNGRGTVRLGGPFDATLLDRAMAAGARLSRTDSHLAVDADLHSAQVLHGERETWLAVDPVLLRGDIAYDLGRVLWTRLDDMPDADTILDHFHAAMTAADIGTDDGRDWVLYRTVDYWLWGLANGLTEDPERCRRLVHAVT